MITAIIIWFAVIGLGFLVFGLLYATGVIKRIVVTATAESVKGQTEILKTVCTTEDITNFITGTTDKTYKSDMLAKEMEDEFNCRL